MGKAIVCVSWYPDPDRRNVFFLIRLDAFFFLLMFQITAADYEGWLILLGFELNFVDIVYVDALRNNSMLFVFFVSVCFL